jgi:hypothetical protein
MKSDRELTGKQAVARMEHASMAAAVEQAADSIVITDTYERRIKNRPHRAALAA